ncbi:MAG: TetR-like C-terminal domain-containing protein [Paracoccus sp. (in: a-proteobacteria)]|nr:TetR-like C-terminal domain-containing protein [Paracoccus sp. (in: a-proteobacteria)]
MDSRHFQSRAAAALLDLIEETRLIPPSPHDLAARLQIHPIKLGEYYSDLDALTLSMVQEAMTKISDTCIRLMVKADPDQPMEQVRALAHGFLGWALDNPAELRLLVDPRVLHFADEPTIMAQILALFRLLEKLLTRARDMRHLHADFDASLAVLSGFSFVYGLARVADFNPLAKFASESTDHDADIRELLFNALDNYVDNLRPRN